MRGQASGFGWTTHAPTSAASAPDQGRLGHLDVDLQGGDPFAAVELDDDLLLIDVDVPGDDRKDLLLQHGGEVGAPRQRPFVGQEQLQAVARDGLTAWPVSSHLTCQARSGAGGPSTS